MPAAAPVRTLPKLPLLGLLLIVLAVSAAVWMGRVQERADAQVVHTVAVEARLAEVLELARRVESAHRGFLIAGATMQFQQEMEEAARLLEVRLETLAEQIRDNPVQRANLAKLRPLVAGKIAFARLGTGLVMRGSQKRAIELIETGRGHAMMRAIEARLQVMIAEENALLRDRIRQAEVGVRLVWLGQIAALLLVLVVASLMVRDASERSEAMEEARDTAQAAAEQLRTEIAAREHAESQLRHLHKMESVGQLTGGIAHDFNNMLAIIIGNLEMAVRRRGDAARMEQALNNAREAAERAASLTARLLAFSRRQPLAPIALDPNRLVSGMSELLLRTLGEHVQVETVLAGGLWRTFVDPSQLENALLNLAVNARDAMPAGGKLTIETANGHLDENYARNHPEVAPGQYVMICVTDTGEGMTPAVIERAFDPFFTTKEVGKGTGLGLSQVFGFVKQSGGHVAIYSEPGAGTTVKIYLPRHIGSDLAELHTPAVEAMPRGRAEEIVLVVEDEQGVRHLSVDALRELGYGTLSASNAREALALIAETPTIALLFTDVVMPEMDGRRLADAALLLRPGLKVLYTTGYTRNAVVHNGLLDAGVSLLQKPFTIEQLARKVREAIDG